MAFGLAIGVTGLLAGLAPGCTLDASTPFPTGVSGSATATATAAAGSATGDGSTSGSGSEAGRDSEGTMGVDGTASASEGPDGTDAAASDTTGSGHSDGSSEGSASATQGETQAGSSTGGDACAGSPLSPLLAVPPLCEPSCDAIGFGVDCPGITVCRLKDSETAVCETCEACGNLHAFCTESIDCDTVFTCFMGQCTAMCDFDTPQTCGNRAACTDVGHPTHGVCDPNI